MRKTLKKTLANMSFDVFFLSFLKLNLKKKKKKKLIPFFPSYMFDSQSDIFILSL